MAVVYHISSNSFVLTSSSGTGYMLRLEKKKGSTAYEMSLPQAVGPLTELQHIVYTQNTSQVISHCGTAN